MTLPKRLAEPLTIGEPAPLAREDLAVLLQPRASAANGYPEKLRESHHAVARLLALQLPHAEIAERTGYSHNRISILANAPAVQELVASYRERLDDSFTSAADAYHAVLFSNMLAAERHISDAISELDEASELLPISKALAISRDAADRLGYGKKREQTVNLNMDFAARLEQAYSRSGKVLDVQRADRPAPAPVRQIESQPNPPLRRRA